MTTALTERGSAEAQVRFDEARDSFLSVQLSKRTKAAYRADLHRFATYWQERGEVFEQVGDLELRHFTDYVAHLVDDLGLAPATIQRRMAVLKSMMRFAKATGLIDHDPISVMRLPRADPVRPGSVHDEKEIRRILEAVNIDRPCARLHRAVLVSLFYVGMRRQELCDLKVRDFYKHGNHHVLRITGKGGRVRIVPLHPIVLATVNNYLAKNRPATLESTDPLFTAAKAAQNKPLRPTRL
jgi:site-specific recombinase XerD